VDEEASMHSHTTTTLLTIGAMLTGAGVVLIAWASTELTHGILEVPDHWWSAMATAPLVAGLALLTVATRARVTRPR
jgi:hypothetical protein